MKNRKCLWFIAIIIATILISPVSVFSEDEVVKEGSLGNIYWKLIDSEDGLTLSLEGEGNMPPNTDYYYSYPWKDEREEIKKLIIGDGIVDTSKNLCSVCSNLETVVFPDGLETIGSGSFCECRSLQNFTLPSSLKTIGSVAFGNCLSLTNITIPEGVTSIESYAFLNGKNLETISLPDSLVSIDKKAFDMCPNVVFIVNKDSYAYNFVKDTLHSPYDLPTGHSIENWTVTKEPTCTEQGVSSGVCSTCEKTFEEPIPAEDHLWNTEYTIDKEPSVIEDGIKSIHCAKCNTVKEGSEIIIQKLAFEDITVNEISDQLFTGRRIEPQPEVFLNEKELKPTIDYDLVYENNTQIGTAQVKILFNQSYGDNKVIVIPFNIVDNPDISEEEAGYLLEVKTNSSTTKRYFEGTLVNVNDNNTIAYKSFVKWVIVSGNLEMPAEDLKSKTISFKMPASDISIRAIYSGQSLEEDLADENSRYNAIVFRASTLDANIELYTNTANSIKNKYGVSYLQSSTYYANQATSTQNTITKKQTRLAALRADTAGGHQVEIKQLEAEIKQLQSDYQMYLELKTAAQYKEKADAAQRERNTINLTTEARKHNNNIANICASHGVKNETVNEIQYIRLDKDEYEYTGSTIHPVITVIDSAGRKLGNESYEVVYPSDCISQGEHVITLNLKGNYTGKKTKTFNIVKHEYGEWVVTEAATCTKEGTRERTCSDCGKKVTESFLAPHNYGEWKTTKAATELAAGKKSRTCSTCGKTETKAISQLKPTLPAVTIVTPVAAKKAATIKWKKVSAKNQKKIAKIQIQYSTDKNFKKNVKTVYAKKTTTSKKITRLTSKKTYYVRIRAYKKSGDKVHVSKWSIKKSVKIK